MTAENDGHAHAVAGLPTPVAVSSNWSASLTSCRELNAADRDPFRWNASVLIELLLWARHLQMVTVPSCSNRYGQGRAEFSPLPGDRGGSPMTSGGHFRSARSPAAAAMRRMKGNFRFDHDRMINAGTAPGAQTCPRFAGFTGHADQSLTRDSRHAHGELLFDAVRNGSTLVAPSSFPHECARRFVSTARIACLCRQIARR
jgi:hypothetical protein